MQNSRTVRSYYHNWPFLLLLLADILLGLDSGSYLRYGAALVLLLFLPGWVWLQRFPRPFLERIVLAIGLSLTLTILSTMGAVYLPGPISVFKLLMISHVIILIGLVIVRSSSNDAIPPRTVALAVLILLLFALALRWPRLGYAEFHEDEAEALMLGVRLLQGEDYALFLHRKGPAQMLIPIAFWLLTDQITETLARFPFALSSLLSVITLFFLGRRWFRGYAGWIAALLWAMNGYAIGFGRMVQYQALIFFLGPLAIYGLYLAWQQSRPQWLILAAMLFAACLLAHFDALLLLPTAIYLLWLYLYRPQSEEKSSLRTRTIWAGASLLLFSGLLAAFYIPYIRDPEFTNTVTYLSESRVKPGFLYNNLKLMGELDRDYSSHFYLPLITLGVISWGWYRRKSITSKTQIFLLVASTILSATTFWGPELWQLGSLNLAIIPWFGLGFLCFWNFQAVEFRTVLIMFGAPFIGYVFLVDDPRTHLYIIYPGLMLLAGAGWSEFIDHQRPKGEKLPLTASLQNIFLVAVGLFLIGAIVIYDMLIFLQAESQLNRLQERWDDSTWEILYDDIPSPREYFGYPKREGWKAIGALRAEGNFPGDFRSVAEDFVIPIWYNYGEARSCYNTPAHFFVRLAEDDLPTLPESYQEVGRVQREGESRIQILSATAESSERITYKLADYITPFDRRATPHQFTQQSEPTHRTGTQFGADIQLVGYDLPAATVQAGETLYLNLYWQALAPPKETYRAFVHLVSEAGLISQQDDHPACRLPTTIWRPGQRGIGQFRLSIPPDTPPGNYPLIVGLYQAESLERLKITSGSDTGQPGDDFLWLGDVKIVH